MHSSTKGKHLTRIERREIERWHNKDKLSNRRIAQRLNKALQTINNELRKGKMHLKTKIKYSAELAQDSYDTRRRHCGRPSKFTKVLNTLISKGVRRNYHLKSSLISFLILSVYERSIIGLNLVVWM